MSLDKSTHSYQKGLHDGLNRIKNNPYKEEENYNLYEYGYRMGSNSFLAKDKVSHQTFTKIIKEYLDDKQK